MKSLIKKFKSQISPKKYRASFKEPQIRNQKYVPAPRQYILVVNRIVILKDYGKYSINYLWKSSIQ